ncbi:prolipoprotein diacylglyceryl transferase [Candidatus Woesearchaeota archaeon]|nr:prolipoprotein diacylglyceryl transferase [Candidatus Woesearchaeota archaeon]
MWIHNLNPAILDLGPAEIRWYGLVYVLGFFLAIWWLLRASKSGAISLTKDEIYDLVFYLMLGVIIGSRLGEIAWEPKYYLSDPLNILKIWQGGMSFHGGFVGIIAACWWYCRKKKLNFWQVADILSVPAIFALALGRIANFINGELVGRVWNGKWCVVFPQYDEQCRHPNMIYSFFERMAVFGWLWWLSLKERFTPGFIFWNFVFWEGLGRILVDFFREDILYFGFSLGQWFSLVMVLVALYVFLKRYKEDWKKVFGGQP